jgi:tetraacyldisaccharide 4'-kinase
VRGERASARFELLRPLGWLGAVVTRSRNLLFDRGLLATHDPGLPVIAVGNLTWGGTGKTPWVSFLIDLLARDGR